MRGMNDGDDVDVCRVEAMDEDEDLVVNSAC